MNLSTILLGMVISSIFGAAFHLILGGGLSRLLLYIFVSWIGFWSGQFLSSYFGWTIGSLGTLHLGVASLTSLIFLGLSYWLSMGETENA